MTTAYVTSPSFRHIHSDLSYGAAARPPRNTQTRHPISKTPALTAKHPVLSPLACSNAHHRGVAATSSVPYMPFADTNNPNGIQAALAGKNVAAPAVKPKENPRFRKVTVDRPEPSPSHRHVTAIAEPISAAIQENRRKRSEQTPVVSKSGAGLYRLAATSSPGMVARSGTMRVDAKSRNGTETVP